MGRTSYIFLFFLLLACQLPQALPTPTPISNPPSPTIPAIAPESSFSSAPLVGKIVTLPAVLPWPSWETLEPQLPEPLNRLQFTASLAEIANPAALPALDDEDRRRLAEQKLLILVNQPDEPVALLDRLLRSGQPYWIGADHVIWRTQTVHTQAIRAVENEMILPLLGRWLTVLADATARQYTGAIISEDHLSIAAAQRNLAYLTIAASQLNPAFPIEPVVAELVQSELALMALGGPFESPYSGQLFDYAGWNDEKNPLVRTQRWLTTVAVVNFDQTAVDKRLQGRQLQLLLSALAEPQAASAWQQLYQTFAYLKGGDSQPTLWRALHAANPDVDSLILTAQQNGESTFFLLPLPQDWRQVVFENLTFNRVGLYIGATELNPFTRQESSAGAIRLRPRPLDLAAALGNQQALELLTSSGDSSYERFDEQLAAVQIELQSRDFGFAQSQRFGLNPLLPQANQIVDRRLDIWRLAIINTPDSWAQLSPSAGTVLYVEPEPELYAYLASVTQQLRNTFALFELLDMATAAALDQLSSELLDLALIANHQLSGSEISPLEQQQLTRWVGAPPAGSLPRPLTYYPTEPSATLTIEAAVPLLAIVPYNGQQMVVSGWTFQETTE